MSNRAKEIDQAIARLLSNESSYEDMIVLDDWLAEDEKNRAEFIALGRYWKTGIKENPEQSAKSFAEARNAIFSSRKKITSGLVASRRIFYVVASVAVVSILVFAGLTGGKQVYNYCSGASLSKHMLPDGTEVILNRNTTLTYSESRFSKKRFAELKGEAFFDVAHDSRHPFVVKAGDAQAKVLGTRFNIKLVEGESVSASLEEGSIEFSSGTFVEVMSPGEHISLDLVNGKVSRTDFGVERYLSWKDGIFRYRSITLASLAEEISSNYGCTVLMDSQLKDIIMSGAFQADQPLEDVLRILQSCLNVNWSINDNIVYLSSK